MQLAAGISEATFGSTDGVAEEPDEEEDETIEGFVVYWIDFKMFVGDGLLNYLKIRS